MEQSKSGLVGLTPEEEAHLMEHGFEYTPLPIPRQKYLKASSMTIAGAQIPVCQDIQKNKAEILKAIDWAKENEVDHILTPEGSLSGWWPGWELKMDELTEALREVEKHQKEAGVGLHLGTNYEEDEVWGRVRRNEIRHYRKDGQINGTTYKTYTTDFECALSRDPYRGEQTVTVPLINDMNPKEYAPVAAGLLCNDLWGWMEAKAPPITAVMKEMTIPFIDLILHATNGQKRVESDPDFLVFDKWHDAFLRMTGWNTNIPLLTVDSCTPWNWDGESDEVDGHPIGDYMTSSTSGVVGHDDWLVTAPRQGRQYFKLTHLFPAKSMEERDGIYE